MPQKETNIWRQIMLDLAPLGVRLFRNQRYKGRICRGNVMTDAYADCGVGGDGGSDLIGIVIKKIRPEDVGTFVAQFCALETKTKTGRASPEQEMFISAINNAGGKAGVARSTEDAKKILGLE